MMNKLTFTIIISSVVVASALGWWFVMIGKNINVPMACTEEAKICPDGSYVVRTGPRCEFTACPNPTSEDDMSDWKTYNNRSEGIVFRYPDTLSTEYIVAYEWPPTVTVTTALFLCAGELRPVGDLAYCVGSESEGVAGSVYKKYTYNVELNHQTVTFVFTLRYPNCSNYNSDKMAKCEQERMNFDLGLDALVHTMVKTLGY